MPAFHWSHNCKPLRGLMLERTKLKWIKKLNHYHKSKQETANGGMAGLQIQIILNKKNKKKEIGKPEIHEVREP